jgi:23S rRNA (pseudouridine1915-N3)-methyltransferase
MSVTELADGKGSPVEIKRREAQAILAAVPADSTAIALDLGATAPTSEALSRQLTQWSEQNRKLAFIIGGAEGLDGQVMARAHHTLSLGPLTWPHLLVRVLLAEQLYRAQCIATGHPYHRAGRP